jgi:hypothetical protein
MSLRQQLVAAPLRSTPPLEVLARAWQKASLGDPIPPLMDIQMGTLQPVAYDRNKLADAINEIPAETTMFSP